MLQNIDAVGNDFEFGPPGTCGKDGQGVPVGDGPAHAAGVEAHHRRVRGMSEAKPSEPMNTVTFCGAQRSSAHRAPRPTVNGEMQIDDWSGR